MAMEYRSSNAIGRTHFGGDVVAGVGANGHNGVALEAVSSGNDPVVRAVGNDTAANLVLRGNSTGAGGVVIGNSTTPLAVVQRYVVQFTEPDMSSGPGNVDSTYTVSGATTNSVYFFTPRVALTTGYGVGDVRCSTADEVTIRWTGNSASTLSGSTNRGTLFQIG